MRNRILTALAIALLAGILAFLGLRGGQRTIVLPDGKTIEFLGTTVGIEPFSSAKPWHKLANSVLPKSLQKWLPRAFVIPCSRATNSITVYVRVTDPSGVPIGGRVCEHFQVEDSDGFKYNPVGSYCSFGASPSSQYVGFTLSAYPRRQKEFRLHLLTDGGDVLGTLTVPNPIKGPFEEWRPLPLPQTATNGPVVLSLNSLRLVGTRRWPTVTPEWKIKSAPPHWRRASSFPFSLFDSSGNEALWLSTNEPAWKLRLTLRRHLEDDFQTHERWLIKDIPVPASGHSTAVDKTTNLIDVKATVHLVSTAGELSVTNGVGTALSIKPGIGFSISTNGTNRIMSWASNKPFVFVEVENLQPDDNVLVNIVDEKGLKLNPSNFSPINHRVDGRPSVHRIHFDLRPETKSLAVEVILNRALVFDFLVNPKDIQITEDSPKP